MDTKSKKDGERITETRSVGKTSFRWLLSVVPVLLWLRWRAKKSQSNSSISIFRGNGSVVGILSLVLLLRRSLKTAYRLLSTRNGKDSKLHMAPPIPGNLPLLGHVLLLSRYEKEVWDWICRTHKSLGRTLSFWAGPRWIGSPITSMMTTTDPANVEHILKANFQNYGKGQKFQEVFEEFLGQGIFAVDGEKWKTQRKTAASIFSRRNFSDNMTHVFQNHARLLVSVLRTRSYTKPKEKIDIQELFFSFTLDTFSEIAFGIYWTSLDESSDCNSKKEEAAATPGLPETVAARRYFAKQFDEVQEACVTRFIVRPLWKLERKLYYWGLLSNDSAEGRIAKAAQHIDEVIYAILEKRAAEPSNMRVGKGDLLSLFLGVTQDLTYLRDMMMNFIIAGRDTTACTLTWLFFEVAKNSPTADSGAFAKIAGEVQREFTQDNSHNLSFEALQRLRYCTACVRETIRLHPPVPFDAKEAFADDRLPDGTLVCKGDFVAYNPYAMARDTGLWGADAAEWKPERWMKMENDPSVYLNCAFQAGPRICLGRDMAILEVKAVLAQVIWMGLRWEVDPSYVPTYRYPSLVQPMADPGLPLRIIFSADSVGAR